MPDMSGFEVLRNLPPEEVPLVIFVTAYDRYAVDAFEVHALDYLLKPLVDNLDWIEASGDYVTLHAGENAI